MCCLLEKQRFRRFRRGDGYASLGQPWRERGQRGELDRRKEEDTGHGTRYAEEEKRELKGECWRGVKRN